MMLLIVMIFLAGVGVGIVGTAAWVTWLFKTGRA